MEAGFSGQRLSDIPHFLNDVRAPDIREHIFLHLLGPHHVNARDAKGKQLGNIRPAIDGRRQRKAQPEPTQLLDGGISRRAVDKLPGIGLLPPLALAQDTPLLQRLLRDGPERLGR